MAHEMGIFEVMYNCRAMRRLKQDPVPEELLVKLIDAANHGPSGSNSQPARWIVVRDGEQKQRLAELNAAAVDAYIQPDSGRASVFPHQSAEQRERQLKAVLWQRHHMHEIPALIIACLKFNAAPSPIQRAGGGGSIWPQVQNLLLAARALGLGAAPTTLGLANRDAAREVLDLPDDIEAYCLIPVGYPMGKFGLVNRLPVEETMCWDRWS